MRAALRFTLFEKLCTVIDYRTFRNADPPELRRLWHVCELGRGAATGFDADVFESVVFCQPYFDRAGVILAVDSDRVVGYLHAGFGPNDAQTSLDQHRGIICMVMVDPSYRHRGIGTRLVQLGEEYLLAAGATSVQAGPAAPNDPFYFGIYGGSQPAGFLASDAAADPFLQKLGYVPISQRLVFQRQLQDRSSPGGLRLMGVRRSTELSIPKDPTPRSWWWSTRPGRLDSLEMALVAKSGGTPLASVTVVGLDFYVARWQQRGIGLMDLCVGEQFRRKGYGQALLVEVCRRVREEMISLAEAHADAQDSAAIKVLKSAGFTQIDTGTVYHKPLPTRLVIRTPGEAGSPDATTETFLP